MLSDYRLEVVTEAKLKFQSSVCGFKTAHCMSASENLTLTSESETNCFVNPRVTFTHLCLSASLSDISHFHFLIRVFSSDSLFSGFLRGCVTCAQPVVACKHCVLCGMPGQLRQRHGNVEIRNTGCHVGMTAVWEFFPTCVNTPHAPLPLWARCLFL